MSQITDFYSGKFTIGLDSLTDIIYRNDAWWEHGHDFIQWCFPLPEASKAVPLSPVATQEDFDCIAESPTLKMRMVALLGRYVTFLESTEKWRRKEDHNHMRITRVLRSLSYCGLNDVAYDFLQYVKAQVGHIVPSRTVWYWDEALKRSPAWLR